MSECSLCGQPTRLIKRVLGVERPMCAYDGGVEPHGVVGDTHMAMCAAADCPNRATITITSPGRKTPLPVCDKGAPEAKGIGVHGPCFMLRPEHVEKKP